MGNYSLMVVAVGIITLPALETAYAAPSVSILYEFPNPAPYTHAGPESSLAMDGTGALYGVYYSNAITYNGMTVFPGTVFKLSPPAAGQSQWTETDIYSFDGTDGWRPSSFIMDSSGALYGTTEAGGPNPAGCGGQGCGVVFKLTPPGSSQGAWTETVLYAFKGSSDGSGPDCGLVLDGQGALYGTTRADGRYGFGTVFKLSPPASGSSSWKIGTLHSFAGGNDGANPQGTLVFDQQGAVYGTTSTGGGGSTGGGANCTNIGCGVVYKLAPPQNGQTGWTESILARFDGTNGNRFPHAGLVFDSAGALYGTAYNISYQGGGTVFQLAPPTPAHKAWTMNVLHVFSSKSGIGDSPQAGVVFDQSGALYGTTQIGGRGDAGVAFKLSPPTAAHPAWLETALYAPYANSSEDQFIAGVILGPDGAIYGASANGGAGSGYVYKITQ